MTKKTIFLATLLIGVATWATDTPDIVPQSDSTSQHNQPITDEDTLAGAREDTPEVVLQIKYDKGELNKIYLAQYRKGPNQFVPTVNARNTLCADLCYGGLGGDPCGSTCHSLLPVGLKTMLSHEGNATDLDIHHSASASSEQAVGEPRTSVCPTLCANMLGEPLCNCASMESQVADHVDWSQVCSAFCASDRYVLGGCPTCEVNHSTLSSRSMRILTTSEGWSAWCNVQCRQGAGGAACNCDRAPFQ